MFPQFSQRDPRWSRDELGAGTDTIGSAGCILTCHAMFGALHHAECNPAWLNAAYKARGLFVNGGPGVGVELTPDNALQHVYSELQLLNVRDFATVPADLNDLGATADQFVYIGISRDGSWPAKHFVAIAEADGPDPLIADSWDGRLKRLSAYGHPATVIVKRVRYQCVAPAKVVPAPPKLVSVPAPPFWVTIKAGARWFGSPNGQNMAAAPAGLLVKIVDAQADTVNGWYRTDLGTWWLIAGQTLPAPAPAPAPVVTAPEPNPAPEPGVPPAAPEVPVAPADQPSGPTPRKPFAEMAIADLIQLLADLVAHIRGRL